MLPAKGGGQMKKLPKDPIFVEYQTGKKNRIEPFEITKNEKNLRHNQRITEILKPSTWSPFPLFISNAILQLRTRTENPRRMTGKQENYKKEIFVRFPGFIVFFFCCLLFSSMVVYAEDNSTLETTDSSEEMTGQTPVEEPIPTTEPTQNVPLEESEDPPVSETPIPTPTAEETEEPVVEEPSASPTQTLISDSTVETSESSPETAEMEIEPRVLTLGVIHVESGATTLAPGGGTGYTFDGSYAEGRIVINDPGSYILREDLGSTNEFAIEIKGSAVTLDGGGYSVSGGGVGSKYGVYLSSSATSTTIKNIDGSAGTAHTGISGFRTAGIGTKAAGTSIQNNNINSNADGIQSSGDGTRITGNTLDGNTGSGISLETGTAFSVGGNTIKNSGTSGIKVESGTGQVYNNKLQNTVNVNGAGISSYSWNQGPERGTNINGGPNIAGNYWSNPSGTGWSDTHSESSTGYTTDPYNVGGTTYDNRPLVKTPVPPQSSGTNLYTLLNWKESKNSDDTSLTTNVNIKLSSAVLSADAVPGGSAKVSLSLENKGGLDLPPDSQIVLVPKNEAAEKTGEVYATNEDGIFFTSITVDIPKEPGSVSYMYQPNQIIDSSSPQEKNIESGEENPDVYFYDGTNPFESENQQPIQNINDPLSPSDKSGSKNPDTYVFNGWDGYNSENKQQKMNTYDPVWTLDETGNNPLNKYINRNALLNDKASDYPTNKVNNVPDGKGIDTNKESGPSGMLNKARMGSKSLITAGEYLHFEVLVDDKMKPFVVNYSF